MEILHKSKTDNAKIELKEGQRGLLCSNKLSVRCPSLRYEQVEEADQAAISRAYDLLFDEVLRLKKLKKIHGIKTNKTNSNLSASFDGQSRGRRDD